ncbi:MAG TPA: hypothetical protein ENK18_27895 [Deltaproteobacteria bacterium]|nr:hypothetical protein [Deltaproteobacteria bacterium]
MNLPPFEPPVRDPAQLEAHASTTRWGGVVGAWGLSGAVVGTSVGATLQLTGAGSSAALLAGTGGLSLGAVLGIGALLWDRAVDRPALVDGLGGTSRPLHGAVLGIPILLALPALLTLVVVATVALGSALPALIFGATALGVVLAGQRVWSSHRLARALEALEAGRQEEARHTLQRLAQRWWVSARARQTARLDLAMLALQEGQATEALRWLEGLEGGIAGAWASLGRALACLLLDEPHERAEAHLRQALTGPRARAIQAQADAVRILVVWRGKGADEARRLAEQLHGPGATPLHEALLARLRAGAGDDLGAQALSRGPVQALVASGLGRAIEELQR